MLDEGKLTDSKGRVVNFKNTIIVLTSNIGSQFIQKMESYGFSNKSSENEYEQTKDNVMGSLKDYFRPEFLNRLDDIIVFDILKKEDIKKIVSLQIEIVAKRLAQKEIKLSVSDEAVSYIAETGFDPHYGARPIKRLIQTEILNPVASALIGRKKENESSVVVSLSKDKKLVVDIKKITTRAVASPISGKKKTVAKRAK